MELSTLGEAKRARLEAGADNKKVLHFVAPGDVITTDTGFMRWFHFPKTSAKPESY